MSSAAIADRIVGYLPFVAIGAGATLIGKHYGADIGWAAGLLVWALAHAAGGSR